MTSSRRTSYNQGSVHQRRSQSASSVKSHSPQTVHFRVCSSPRDRNALRPVVIRDDGTLARMKEDIKRQLNLEYKLGEFSLARYDEHRRTWIPIHEADDWKTVAEFNFTPDTILSIEHPRERTPIQSRSSSVDSSYLTLQLCQRPMDRTDGIYVCTYKSAAVSEVKQVARQKVKNQNTDSLYVWENDAWTKYESELDDITLAGLSIGPYSWISFAEIDDSIPGVCGLNNLGNTCFMSSALQCLSNVPTLKEAMLTMPKAMNAPIIGAFSALMKTLWSGKHTVTTPSDLLLSTRDALPRFTRYRQQDAHEFLNYFLHSLHDELTNKEALITELFHGKIRSSVRCLGHCHSTEMNDESISFLPLPIDDHQNQYRILYLRHNGEQTSVLIQCLGETVGALITSFIEQHEPRTPVNRIQAVYIVDHEIRTQYRSSDRLKTMNKDQLTLIERPNKTFEQDYVELRFIDRKTRKPFRPPIFLVRPTYECRHSDVIGQINRIRDCLFGYKNIPAVAGEKLYWLGDSPCLRPLEPEKDRRDYLTLLKSTIIEIEHEMG